MTDEELAMFKPIYFTVTKEFDFIRFIWIIFFAVAVLIFIYVGVSFAIDKRRKARLLGDDDVEVQNSVLLNGAMSKKEIKQAEREHRKAFKDGEKVSKQERKMQARLEKEQLKASKAEEKEKQEKEIENAKNAKMAERERKIQEKEQAKLEKERQKLKAQEEKTQKRLEAERLKDEKRRAIEQQKADAEQAKLAKLAEKERAKEAKERAQMDKEREKLIRERENRAEKDEQINVKSKMKREGKEGDVDELLNDKKAQAKALKREQKELKRLEKENLREEKRREKLEAGEKVFDFNFRRKTEEKEAPLDFFKKEIEVEDDGNVSDADLEALINENKPPKKPPILPKLPKK